MKLLLDNNLSFKIVKHLQTDFSGSDHIRNVLATTADDLAIWEYAKRNGFVILTKDNDFDERSQLNGCPPKVIHLICGNVTTKQLIAILQNQKDNILQFEFDNISCILKIS